jgi:hypothetical protein
MGTQQVGWIESVVAHLHLGFMRTSAQCSALISKRNMSA